MNIKQFVLALIFILLGVSPTRAEVTINDSKSAVEKEIASILKAKFAININLETIKKNDIQAQIIFRPNDVLNIPSVGAIIDTKILSRDKNQKAMSQIISFISVAQIKIETSDKEKILNWINDWNGKISPVRVWLKGNTIHAGSNILIEPNMPVSDNRVARTFINIIQVWPSIIKELEGNSLIK
jgi:hypothetical protein